MPIPAKYLSDFQENGIYHVYNRTNNKERLFLCDENRNYFLRKYDEYLSPFLDTYAWCLLPNHFHLLVKSKPASRILSQLNSRNLINLSIVEKRFIDKSASLNDVTVQAFKRFFQCYSLSFNKMHKRQGNLFYKPFKRVEIGSDSQLTQTIVYIHANPVKHKIVKDFTLYPWSSWQTILSDSQTTLLRNEILQWFGGRDNFVKTHVEMSRYYKSIDTAIED